MVPKLIFSILISLLTHMSFAQQFTFMTYNIRYGTARDGENSWEFRKNGLAEQIKFYEPDVFGIQEGLEFQVEYLDSALSEYNYYGVGRDDGQTKGEYSAVFYKKNKFNVLNNGTFWLSQTPGEISTGWDAQLPRVCSYMVLENKVEGEKIAVFNTHFDHVGEEARKESARLIIQKIQEIKPADAAVVLMGDLNLEPQTEPIKYLSKNLTDARLSSKEVTFGPEGTFTGFNFTEPPERRIDYIFTDPDRIEVIKYAVLTDSKDNKYYSDHLPVYVEVNIK